jgi:DNA (cytosine-5)-methyltransferase 1
MSYGFACRPSFQIIAAVDAEKGKPSEGFGRLGCNDTYRKDSFVKLPATPHRR